jgi:putative membrane protein
MGCAEVVPGISGGTVALVLGIYERLLASLRETLNAAIALVRRDPGAARAALGRLDWGLLVPLLLGMAVAVLAGAAIIPPLLDEYPAQSSALFFGLILASLVVPWRMARRRLPAHFAIAAVLALVAFVLTGIPEREIADPSKLVVFGAAAIAICALTLPGVSGSYLLLAMGLYAPTLDAVDGRDVGYLAVFALGALTGLALFTRVLTRLLADHRDATVMALFGLMVGSLRALWPWSEDDGTLLGPPADGGEVLGVVAMALVGIAVVATLLLVTRDETDLATAGPPPAPDRPAAASSPTGAETAAPDRPDRTRTGSP